MTYLDGFFFKYLDKWLIKSITLSGVNKYFSNLQVKRPSMVHVRFKRHAQIS